MAYFLFHGSYSNKAMAALVDEPEDRSIYIRSIVERLDGKLEGFWLAFGTSDFYAVVQLPSTQNAAAFAMSVVASGGVRGFVTVPLMTWAEGVGALQVARRFGYHPPTRGDER